MVWKHLLLLVKVCNFAKNKIMKEIIGDLVRDAEQFDVILHQCNCFCNMGAGIAPQIKKKYPEAYLIDCQTKYGDKNKLGTISYTKKQIKPIVVNAYGQYKYTRSEVDTNYEALRSCLKEVKKIFPGRKIGMPKIGAGLAAGDWNIISKIIQEELKTEDVTIVIWEKDV